MKPENRTESQHQALANKLGLLDPHFVHVDMEFVDGTNIADFHQKLQPYFPGGELTTKSVVVDLDGVLSARSSEFYRGLVLLGNDLKKAGHKMVLLDVSPELHGSLALAGFTKLFRIETSEI